MFKYFVIFFIILYSNAQATNKNKIIKTLQSTENLSFKFEQNINGQVEFGNCTIQYPKKIFCKYQKNNKILVSNGKSLVIKTIIVTKNFFWIFDSTITSFNFTINVLFKIKTQVINFF